MAGITFGPFDLASFERHIDAFLCIAADVPGEYWTAENFRRTLPEKWLLSFAAYYGNQPIGYAILSRRATFGIHLHHFMIAAAYRGQGIGTHMIEEMVRRAIQAEAPEITLKVANARAEAFYRRHQFILVEEENGYRLYRRRLSIAGD